MQYQRDRAQSSECRHRTVDKRCRTIQIDISYESEATSSIPDDVRDVPNRTDGEPDVRRNAVPSLTITTAATLNSGEAAIVIAAPAIRQQENCHAADCYSTAIVGRESAANSRRCEANAAD